MMYTEDDIKAVESLINAVNSNDELLKTKEKYNFLWRVSDLFELIPNYVFLDKIGVSFDFGRRVVGKGTKLFRIRAYDKNFDFSNPKEWQPSPLKRQNRANREGKEALYLGSTEMICFLETHMKEKQKYALGMYECIEDFEVGGFLSFDKHNNLHTLAAIVLNAFLIAPSRSEKNKELFSYLDDYLGKVTLDNLTSLKDTVLNEKEEILLPFKFAVLNQGDKLYNLTNRICEVIEKQTPNGIRYSSCYIPLETPGIECSDYNLVLYQKGISKLKFMNYEIKEYSHPGDVALTDVNVVKTLLGGIGK